MSQTTPIPKPRRLETAFNASAADWYTEAIPPRRPIAKIASKYQQLFLKWAKSLSPEKKDSLVREPLLWFYHQDGVLPGPLLRCVAIARFGLFSKDLLLEIRDKYGGKHASEMKSHRGRQKIIKHLKNTKNLVSHLKRLLPTPKQHADQWAKDLENCERVLDWLAEQVEKSKQYSLLFPGRGRQDTVMIKILLNTLAAYIQTVTSKAVNGSQKEHLGVFIKLMMGEVWSPTEPGALAKKWIRSSNWIFAPSR